MAVAFDAVASNQNSATASLTWTHTPVGTPTGVSVAAVMFDSSAGTFTADYGGTSMGAAQVTLASSQFGNTIIQIWGLSNPPPGAKVVTIAQGGANFTCTAGSTTVTGGVVSGSPFSNTASNGNIIGASPSMSITSATGELVIDIISMGNGITPTATGSGQTLRWSIAPTFDAAGSSAAGAASYTVSYSLSGGTGCDIVGASFAAGASVPPIVYTLMGSMSM